MPSLATDNVSSRPDAVWLSLPLKLADKLVFSKIRARFGGELRIAISGAAPLGKELGAFYDAIGMPLPGANRVSRWATESRSACRPRRVSP